MHKRAGLVSRMKVQVWKFIDRICCEEIGWAPIAFVLPLILALHPAWSIDL